MINENPGVSSMRVIAGINGLHSPHGQKIGMGFCEFSEFIGEVLAIDSPTCQTAGFTGEILVSF